MAPTVIGIERQVPDSDQLPDLNVRTTPSGVPSQVLRISASPGWVRLSAAELKEHLLRAPTRR